MGYLVSQSRFSGSLDNWMSWGASAQETWLSALSGRRSRFETRSFTGSTGSRDYRLFIPARRPRGLIVLLHGCTQTAESFALATGMNVQAEKHGLVVAYPEQTSSYHRKACWNWYRPVNQLRGSGEPAIIAELTQELVSEFAIDADRVFVAGLSAGGAMAAILGETYPGLYSAVGIHSGVGCGMARNLPSALRAMKGYAGWLSPSSRSASERDPRRTIVFHGTADPIVHPVNAERIIAGVTSGLDVQTQQETGTSKGGRSYVRTTTITADGSLLSELWLIEGSEHGWSGGLSSASYTDPSGPNASAEMVRFFLQSAKRKPVYAATNQGPAGHPQGVEAAAG